jgi:hypothetical protein
MDKPCPAAKLKLLKFWLILLYRIGKTVFMTAVLISIRQFCLVFFPLYAWLSAILFGRQKA